MRDTRSFEQYPLRLVTIRPPHSLPKFCCLSIFQKHNSFLFLFAGVVVVVALNEKKEKSKHGFPFIRSFPLF